MQFQTSESCATAHTQLPPNTVNYWVCILYVWTNVKAQRGAEGKHWLHGAASQFKRSPFQHHEPATQLRAGWQIILLWEWGEKKKAVNLFPLAALSLSLPLSLSPHDPILLFNHVYSLPPFRQLFSPPIRLMQSISQNRLDGIIRGARERTVHPLQSSSNKSNTQSIHTTHTNLSALPLLCSSGRLLRKEWVARQILGCALSWQTTQL